MKLSNIAPTELYDASSTDLVAKYQSLPGGSIFSVYMPPNWYYLCIKPTYESSGAFCYSNLDTTRRHHAIDTLLSEMFRFPQRVYLNVYDFDTITDKHLSFINVKTLLNTTNGTLHVYRRGWIQTQQDTYFEDMPELKLAQDMTYAQKFKYGDTVYVKPNAKVLDGYNLTGRYIRGKLTWVNAMDDIMNMPGTILEYRGTLDNKPVYLVGYKTPYDLSWILFEDSLMLELTEPPDTYFEDMSELKLAQRIDPQLNGFDDTWLTEDLPIGSVIAVMKGSDTFNSESLIDAGWPVSTRPLGGVFLVLSANMMLYTWGRDVHLDDVSIDKLLQIEPPNPTDSAIEYQKIIKEVQQFNVDRNSNSYNESAVTRITVINPYRASDLRADYGYIESNGTTLYKGFILRKGWGNQEPPDTYFEDMSELKLAQEDLGVVKDYPEGSIIVIRGTPYIVTSNDGLGPSVIIWYSDILQYKLGDEYLSTLLSLQSYTDLKELCDANNISLVYTRGYIDPKYKVDKVIRRGWITNEPKDTYFEDMSELKLAQEDLGLITDYPEGSIVSVKFAGSETEHIYGVIGYGSVSLTQKQDYVYYDEEGNEILDETYDEPIDYDEDGYETDLDTSYELVPAKLPALFTNAFKVLYYSNNFLDISMIESLDNTQDMVDSLTAEYCNLTQESIGSVEIVIFITPKLISNYKVSKVLRYGFGEPKDTYFEDMSELKLAQAEKDLGCGKDYPEGSIINLGDASASIVIKNTSETFVIWYSSYFRSHGTPSYIQDVLLPLHSVEDIEALCNAHNRSMDSSIYADSGRMHVIEVYRIGWGNEPPDTYFEDMSELKLAQQSLGRLKDYPTGSILDTTGNFVYYVLENDSNYFKLIPIFPGECASLIPQLLTATNSSEAISIYSNYCNYPCLSLQNWNKTPAKYIGDTLVTGVIRRGELNKELEDTYFEDMSELKLAQEEKNLGKLGDYPEGSILTFSNHYRSIGIVLNQVKSRNSAYTTIWSMQYFSNKGIVDNPIDASLVLHSIDDINSFCKKYYDSITNETYDCSIDTPVTKVHRIGWGIEPLDTYFEDMSELKVAQEELRNMNDYPEGSIIRIGNDPAVSIIISNNSSKFMTFYTIHFKRLDPTGYITDILMPIHSAKNLKQVCKSHNLYYFGDLLDGWTHMYNVTEVYRLGWGFPEDTYFEDMSELKLAKRETISELRDGMLVRIKDMSSVEQTGTLLGAVPDTNNMLVYVEVTPKDMNTDKRILMFPLNELESVKEVDPDAY